MSFHPVALFDHVLACSSHEDSVFDAYGGFVGFIGFLLLSALISFVFYIVPVLIYRFGIRKQPIQPRMKAQGVTFLFFICSMVAMYLFTVLLAVASGEEAESIQLGLLDVACYIANSFILMYEGKPTQATPITPATPSDEAERWKKQYFDLYTRTQQSDQTSSFLDGLSPQEIEQVLQYIEFLKKSRLKINEVDSSEPSSPQPVTQTKNAPPAPHPETFIVDIEKIHKEAEQAAIQKSPSPGLSEEQIRRYAEEDRKSGFWATVIVVSIFVTFLVIIAVTLG